jgi:hypothetical protein
MSSKPVAQQLEKKILKRSPHGIWTKGEMSECGDDENVVFENLLETTPNTSSVNAEKVPVEPNIVKEVNERIQNVKDVDKIDYFDSEDEYWETQTSNMGEDYYLDTHDEEYLSSMAGAGKHGRYSKISA